MSQKAAAGGLPLSERLLRLANQLTAVPVGGQDGGHACKPPPRCPRRSPPMISRLTCLVRRPLPAALLLLLAACSDRAALAETPVVKLVIDYGDGVEKRFTQLPHVDDMTVLDAMRLAAKHKRGIRFEFRGSGSTAFLFQIDDLKNEGRGRNWIYRVNDKLGEVSFGLHKLQSGDTVEWKFGKYP
jgi:hypothetical protein